LIGLYAEKTIAYTDANGGSCRQVFVKNLVDAAARVASVLQITCLDINNEVRRIRSKHEDTMTVQREVSLSESFALLEPSTTITACAASDTLSSMSANAEEDTIQELQNETPLSGLLASLGLNLFASIAAKSNYPQLLNRCPYPGCGAPNCLVDWRLPNDSSFGKSNVAFIVEKPKFWDGGGGVYSKSAILML
jgi:hypothetical protein